MTSGNSNRSQSPSLSPVLLLGFLVRPLPIAGLQPLLRYAMQRMKNRHAEVFDRMAANGEMAFLIDPIDLPFAFELNIVPSPSSLYAIERPSQLPAHMSAAIRGSLMSLLALIEGRVDGDALFFSRDLMIEGDTEAVLALRNAVDGADIDIIEDLSAVGPLFSRPAKTIAHTAQTIFQRMSKDLDTVSASFREPLERRLKSQSAELKRQNERVDEISKKMRRRGKIQP